MSNKCFVRVFGKQSEIVKFLAERQQSPFLIYLLSSDPPILHHSWNPHLLLLELWHMSVPTPPPPPFQETGKVFTLYELKYCIVRISDLGFF